MEDIRISITCTLKDFRLISAAILGEVEKVKICLNDSNVNPGADGNRALCMACAFGRVKIVSLLVQQRQVNPTDCDNYAIRLAAEEGHLDVVKTTGK